MSAGLLAAAAAAFCLLLVWGGPPVVRVAARPVRPLMVPVAGLATILAVSGQWIVPLAILGAAGVAGRTL